MLGGKLVTKAKNPKPGVWINDQSVVRWAKGDYMICETHALFASGFNVYKRTNVTEERQDYERLPYGETTFFLTLKGAKDWLKQYLADQPKP